MENVKSNSKGYVINRRVSRKKNSNQSFLKKHCTSVQNITSNSNSVKILRKSILKKRKRRKMATKKENIADNSIKSIPTSLPIKTINSSKIKFGTKINNHQKHYPGVSDLKLTKNKISYCSVSSKVPNAANQKPNKNNITTKNKPSSRTLISRALSKKKGQKIICLMNNKLHYSLERYERLQNLVKQAVNEQKIFLIYGKAYPVRRALKRRGWLEKLSRKTFNDLKCELPFKECNPKTECKAENLIIHILLANYQPNFHWLMTSDSKILSLKALQMQPFVNRIKRDDKDFTTKEGLCNAIKCQHWFYIDNISEVKSPRSYNIFNNDEMEEFKKDYRITSCTNLLQWFIKNNNKKQNKSTNESCQISFSLIFFALKRCQVFIREKQHTDIDRSKEEPTPAEWDNFIKSYFKVITNRAELKEEHSSVLNFYKECSIEVLRSIKRYKPELDCEGYRNIWIAKPACLSRGRGIKLMDSLKSIIDINSSMRVQKYIIQKYIEKPLIIYGTKFDIRQYYLITNTHPLQIWIYKECYLRFSSQNYSLNNFHESIHLTNNAIQSKYTNARKRNENLPAYNMWNLEEFKSYLSKIGAWDVWNEVIYPGMKKNIVGAMLNCQEGLSHRNNQFELFGCDFILDENYEPWLIEINSCPDMSGSTPVTSKICPQTMEDIIKVVVDHKKNPKSETGDFECIYKQKITRPILNTDMSSLMVHGTVKWCENKMDTDHKYLYKEICSDPLTRLKLPWKNEIIRKQNVTELIKMQYEDDVPKGDAVEGYKAGEESRTKKTQLSSLLFSSTRESIENLLKSDINSEGDQSSNIHLNMLTEKSNTLNTITASKGKRSLFELLNDSLKYEYNKEKESCINKKLINGVFYKNNGLKIDLHKILPNRESKEFPFSGLYRLIPNNFKRTNRKYSILRKYCKDLRLPNNPFVFRSKFICKFGSSCRIVERLLRRSKVKLNSREFVVHMCDSCQLSYKSDEKLKRTLETSQTASNHIKYILCENTYELFKQNLHDK